MESGALPPPVHLAGSRRSGVRRVDAPKAPFGVLRGRRLSGVRVVISTAGRLTSPRFEENRIDEE